MKFDAFLEGLTILRRHITAEGGGYHIGAEHDQFYVYATNIPLAPEDVKRMVDLGWFQPDRGAGKATGPETYDPGEGWSAFT
jgi:hypothetical protein